MAGSLRGRAERGAGSTEHGARSSAVGCAARCGRRHETLLAVRRGAPGDLSPYLEQAARSCADRREDAGGVRTPALYWPATRALQDTCSRARGGRRSEHQRATAGAKPRTETLSADRERYEAVLDACATHRGSLHSTWRSLRRTGRRPTSLACTRTTRSGSSPRSTTLGCTRATWRGPPACPWPVTMSRPDEAELQVTCRAIAHVAAGRGWSCAGGLDLHDVVADARRAGHALTWELRGGVDGCDALLGSL